MADLYSQILRGDSSTDYTVGANARKSVISYPGSAIAAANPFSQLGTRKIKFHKITGNTGVGTSPEAADSVFNDTVRAIQEVAELYYINAVAANTCIIGIAEDNDNGAGVGNTDNDKTVKEAIDAGTGNTVTVGAADTAVFQVS
jgi:hypothetical protein